MLPAEFSSYFKSNMVQPSMHGSSNKPTKKPKKNHQGTESFFPR